MNESHGAVQEQYERCLDFVGVWYLVRKLSVNDLNILTNDINTVFCSGKTVKSFFPHKMVKPFVIDDSVVKNLMTNRKDCSLNISTYLILSRI